ncbi:hypothetical protein SAMN05443247_10448, partial [Bradyrhizobium erythrophlei]
MMTYTRIINGPFGRHTLVGATGNDLLTGGADSESYVISRERGSDVINDLQASAGRDVFFAQDDALATLASSPAVAKQTHTHTAVTLFTSDTLSSRTAE